MLLLEFCTSRRFSYARDLPMFFWGPLTGPGVLGKGGSSATRSLGSLRCATADYKFS